MKRVRLKHLMLIILVIAILAFVGAPEYRPEVAALHRLAQLILPQVAEAQGLVEYALILVLVAEAVTAELELLGCSIGNVFCDIVEALGFDDGGGGGGGGSPHRHAIAINEIMYGLPAGSQWFEVYNLANVDDYLSSCTTYIYNGHGGRLQLLDSPQPHIPPNGFFVFGNSAAKDSGVPVDYEWDDCHFNLGDPAGQIILLDDQEVIDRVEYGPGFPDPYFNGSISLKDPKLDNNVGSNWCASTTPFYPGPGYPGLLGTPGAANICLPQVPSASAAMTEGLIGAAAEEANASEVRDKVWAFADEVMQQQEIIGTAVTHMGGAAGPAIDLLLQDAIERQDDEAIATFLEWQQWLESVYPDAP